MWEDEILIYYNNLSNCYIFSIIVSFSAVFLTVWMKYYNKKEDINSEDSKTISNSNDMTKDLFRSEDEADGDENEDVITNKVDGVISKIKILQQKAITDALMLTEQQIRHEKIIQSQQINEILNKLKEQEDKFQISDSQSLEDQLKLYGLK
ncbi:uncharacterized protein LOC123298979 [Chrysoperla carnea]|uniref:uncharacterized protein LOC123298979 n=1 Tax=Chrysoperla carnea TaxID=189513 RepID=UPI001D073B8E|nr:uncharacterized protein LOC123298979 [Chrysoperla carnea]